MKKKICIGAMAILILILISIFINFGSKSEVFEIPEKRVTFVAPFVTNDYWGAACNGAIKEGQKYGIDVNAVSSVEMSEEKLIKNLKHAIFSNVDGIITYGMGGNDDFLDILELAEEKKIPVVLIDSNVDTEHKLAYVGTDNYLSGQLAAEEMVKECDGKGKVMVMVSFLNMANQTDRVAGFQEVMDKYPDMEIVEILEGESNTMLGEERIISAIQENSEINGIFCAEGMSTISVCNAMKKHKADRKEMHVITYEDTNIVETALKKGYISATIKQNPKEMGHQAVYILNAYFNGESFKNREWYTKITVIRKEDIEDKENSEDKGGEIQWHYY